ncbi:uncharacterized protein RHO25_012921 [Cercospora beticola]|nr:hypothetical protein RHO25_012921 [Cercospora beticola]
MGNFTETRDFGEMARMVSKLAEIAEQNISSTSELSAALSTAVTNLFSFWSSEKIEYFPWRKDRDPHEDQSTGIVIPVGKDYVYMAAITMVTLREILNSTLPIELAYLGEDDLPLEWREYLFDLVDGVDIEAIDLTKSFDQKLVDLKGYDTKPFAILASRHARVILLDADAVFYTKPDDAFETHPSLKEYGSLYFHDRAKYWGDPRRKPVEERTKWLTAQLSKAGREPSTFLTRQSFLWAGGFVTESQDSAVVMFDKSRPRNYMMMLFTAWMNAASGGKPEIYSYFHGDKETYWVAGELTGIPFHFNPWSSGRAGRAPEELSYSAAIDAGTHIDCTEHMVHSTWDGKQPWLTNGGILGNGKAIESGFVNWTHWYLGETIPDALSRTKAKLNLPPDFDWSTHADAKVKEEFAKEAVAHQPKWDTCDMNHPERWKPLSQDFRDTLSAIVARAKLLAQDYQARRVKIERKKNERNAAKDDKAAANSRRRKRVEQEAQRNWVSV